MNSPPHSKHAPDDASQGAQASWAGDAPADAGTAGNTVIDPICGMQVDPLTTAHHATHAGADYHQGWVERLG